MSSREFARPTTKKDIANCHILIVEDQKSIAQMTANLLKERWGCNVTIANSYAQTKEILKHQADHFFIVISDLNLPDAADGEIIDLLIAHKQKVVAITGYFDQALHAELSQKGVVDYVLKKNINAYEYLSKLIGRLYFNQSIKVLVIDDSESIQKVTGAYLKKQFLNVIYASDGQKGLAILHENPDIKLILVDAKMPNMDGLTFTAMARKQKDQNNLSIIGISSSDEVDLSAQFLKHGANDFISKPFSYDELTCRVNQNLSMLGYIEEIANIANVDYLTQMPNRRHFFNVGELAIKHAIAEKNHTIVAIMDIDFFKSINDNYGHDCGDFVLKEMANILKDHLADHIYARIGGEEFGFIISAANFIITKGLIESLLQRVAAHHFIFKEMRFNITVSIGASYEIRGNLDRTLKDADQNLYLAKMSGRNKVVWNHGQHEIKLELNR